MAAPIEIGVGVDGKAVRTGVENDIIDPIEDAEKAILELGKSGDKASDGLDDAGRAGRKAGDQIEKSLESAQRESDRTRREIGELSDAIEKAGRKGSEIDDGFRKGAQGAGEATAEFKDEAISNLSETVSSFRGDAEDIAQIAQDTLGGVVANLGPVGMAAGVAGAVGIGLIISEIEKAKEAEQEFREQVAELADTIIETGGEGAEYIAALASKFRELAAPTEEGAKGLAEIKREAEAAGIPVAELAEAYAGAGGDLSRYIELMDEGLEKTHGLGVTATRSNQAQREGYKQAREALVELAEQQEAAAEAAKIWEEAGGAAIQARANAMETLQGELDEAMGSFDDFKDAETGALDPSGYLAGMQARLEATSNFNSNVQTLAQQFGLSHDEVQAILDQGVDFAPMLQSILDSGMGEQYAGQVRAMLDGGQAIVDGTPITSTVTAESDTAQAQSDLDAAATGRTADVTAKASTSAAEKDLAATTDKKRTATITAKADTTSATSALDTAAKSRISYITASASTFFAAQQLDRLAQDRTMTIHARVVDQRGVEVP